MKIKFRCKKLFWLILNFVLKNLSIFLILYSYVHEIVRISMRIFENQKFSLKIRLIFRDLLSYAHEIENFYIIYMKIFENQKFTFKIRLIFRCLLSYSH